MANENYRRPILLSVVALLSIIGAIIVILSGIVMIVMGASSEFAKAITDSMGGENSAIASMGAMAAGAFILVLGLIILAVGLGLWNGKAWAWWLSIIVYGIVLIFSLYSVIVGGLGNILGVLWPAFVVFYLTRPNTKGWFDI